MIGDVTMKLTDGGLGNVAKGTDGIHACIGCAESGDNNVAYSATSFPEIQAILGYGPLLERFRQYYKEFDASKKQKPPKVYFVKAEADVPGSIGEPVLTGDSEAQIATSGSPLASRSFRIEILTGGACGTATYRKSIDGGKSWSDELTVPASGTPLTLGSGISVTFTDAATPADSFSAGDIWSFASVGPSASNASLLAAIDVLKQQHEVRFVHVMGESTKAFWASCAALADDWDINYRHPVWFVVEATKRSEGQTVAEWAIQRINEAKGFTHKRVLKVCQSGENKDTALESNLATVLCAKLSAGRVHEAPGFVDKFGFLTISKLIDYAELSEKAGGASLLDALDDNKYICAVEYEDYPGFYFSHGNTCADETSDYQKIEILRPADKIRRIGRQAIMKFLNSPSHAEAGIGGIATLVVTIDNAIGEAMEIRGDREIVSHETLISEDQDVLGTGKVEGKIAFIPIGSMGAIDIDITASKE